MVDPNGEFPWLAAIWAATKVAGLVTGGAFAIDAGNQVRANLYSGMSLGDAIAGVDGWGSLRRSAEWGVSAGLGHITGAYTAARVTHGLMTAGRAAMINNTIDIGTGFFWETVVNRNGAGSAAFNAVAGSTFGGILGASGKGAGWMLGRLGAGADWVGRQMNWSPRWALPNRGSLARMTDVPTQHPFPNMPGKEEPSNIFYRPLDAIGRPTGVDAVLERPLTEIPYGTNSIGKRNWSKEDPDYHLDFGLDRTHLLAHELGGRNTVRNLVAFSSIINQSFSESGGFRYYETMIEKAVRGGQTVRMSVTPIYRGNERIPIGITMIARGSGDYAIDIRVSFTGNPWRKFPQN